MSTEAVPDLLAIGDFARATHLSVKTLRRYHDLGLLVPAVVDPRSGYRRYATEQIPIGHVVRRFRDLDMPLKQIRAVLDAHDLPTRNRLIAEHLKRLEDALNRTHTAVTSLRDLLQGPPPSAAIHHRSEPALLTAAIAETVDAADLSAWFQGALDELRDTMAAQHVAAAGPWGPSWPTRSSPTSAARSPSTCPSTGVSARSVGPSRARCLPSSWP